LAGRLDADALLEHVADDLLHHLVDVIHVGEGHLEIDLGELGLAILPEVLVAEALGDLEVPIEAGHHEELLVELRALGEGVELAGVEPRRHQEVAGAAGRVLHHERRLELEEVRARRACGAPRG
jgi:hypothetical protein